MVRRDDQGNGKRQWPVGSYADRTIAAYRVHAEAAGRNWAQGWRPSRFLREFAAALPLGGRVLDYGCGTGVEMAWLISRGFRMEGIDGALEFALEARRLCPGTPVLHTRFETVALPPGRYDGIWCNAALIHVPPEDLTRQLEKLRQALRPGGRLGLTLAWGRGKGFIHRDWIPGRYLACYTKPEAAAFLRDWASCRTRVVTGEGRRGCWIQILASCHNEAVRRKYLMRQKTALFAGLVFSLVLSAAGCQMKIQHRAFPSKWPSGLSGSGSTSNLAALPEPAWPAVTVEPFVFDAEIDSSNAGSGGPSTSRTLTNLMIEKLKEAGVRVSETDAEYALSGTIPKLGWTERSGYPRKLYYTSEMVYRLVYRPTGAVVWEGNLSQDFEQTVLVNTMTRLPEDPNAPERILLEKCISPNWEAIASDVKTYLKKNSAPLKE